MAAPDPSKDTYVSLTTFRRDGREVSTPVWIAGTGRFYVFTAADSGKVKRIRANRRIRLATCDVRGNVKSDWVDGQARVLSTPGEVARALEALRRKYGWTMRVTDFFAKLSGRFSKRAYLEIALTD